jgi:hypothetical protein
MEPPPSHPPNPPFINHNVNTGMTATGTTTARNDTKESKSTTVNKAPTIPPPVQNNQGVHPTNDINSVNTPLFKHDKITFLNTPHCDNIFINKQGYPIIYNINKKQALDWYSQTTNNWKKWMKRYKGNFAPFTASHRSEDPGQRGFKNAHLILTCLITKNMIQTPSTLDSYIKWIKEVWNDQGVLRRTQKGQKL